MPCTLNASEYFSDPCPVDFLQSYDHILSIILEWARRFLVGFTKIPFFLGVGVGGTGQIKGWGLEY